MAAGGGKNTINTRIALEGAEAIVSMLRGMGQAGEEAFDKLKSGAESVGASGDKAAAAITKVQAAADQASTASGRFGQGLQLISSGVQQVGLVIGALSGAFAGVTGALAAFAKGGAEAADAMDKGAQSLGLSIKEYGRLQFAFEQADVAAEEFFTVMSRLNKAIDDTRDKGAGATTALAKLGVNVAKGRDTTEILSDLADKFKNMEDGAEKSAIAIEIFGRSGARLVPLLNEGREGIKALGDEAEALGLVFTKQQSKIGDDMGDALNRANRAARGLTHQIGLLFAPSVTRAADAFTEMVKRNREAIIAMGQAIVRFAAPIFEDFVNTVLGNDQDVGSSWMLLVRDLIVGVGAAFKTAFTGVILPVLRLFRDTLDALLAPINAVFGTQLSGSVIAATAAILRFSGVLTVLRGAFLLLAGTAGLLAPIPLAITAIVVGVALLYQYLQTNTWADFGAAAIGVLQAIVGFVVGLYNSIVEGAVDAWNAFVSAAQSAVAAIPGVFEALWEMVKSGASAAWEAVSAAMRSAFDTALSYISGVIDTIMGWINAAIDKARALAAAISGGGSSSSSSSSGDDFTPSFAGGGRVWGPGTSTSDSIPARLSRGEYVVRAAAVQHYGPRLFDMLNRMRFARGALVQRFADGGLVRGLQASLAGIAAPLFPGGQQLAAAAAGGGSGVPMASINLTIGGERFEGLMAPREVGDRLQRFLLSDQIKAAGRMPGIAEMAVTYRTPDAGRWGAGKGSDLTAAEVDRNFWDLWQEFLAAVAALEDPDVISNIEVVGSQMTLFTAAGETFGPFTLPVAMLHWRGAWTASTAYSELDIVRSAPHGTFLVLLDHTSDAVAFDPLEVNGSAQPLYYQLLPPAESESSSFLLATDMPDAMGPPGQILVVNPAGDAMVFEDPTVADHSHVVGDITDFPLTMPPDAHSHTMAEITDFPGTVAEMPAALGAALHVLRVNAAGDGLEFAAAAGGGGAQAFTELTDAPASYTGHAGKVVAVTAGEDGLEFVAPGGGGASALDDLSDVTLGTPAAGDVLTFNGSLWEATPPAPPAISLNALSGTSYTLMAGDANTKYVRHTNAAASTITVPPNVFSVGDQITIRQVGAGQITLVEGSGVTITTPETLKARKVGSTLHLVCVAANTFDLTGDLELA